MEKNELQFSSPVIVSVYALTDTGRVRKNNEDSFLVVDTTNQVADALGQIRRQPLTNTGFVLMVSDGMGGAAAGEIASALAVQTVRQEVNFTTPPDKSRFRKRLEESLQKANQVITLQGKNHPEMYGLGTTATIAGILQADVCIGQVGDSRAYLLRNGKIEQLTRDQSLVNQLVEVGSITEEEAETHPRRHVLLQALGNQTNLKVDFTEFTARIDDYLLLCSDGLSGLLQKEEMLELVAKATDVKDACQQLVDAANQKGGFDNITVILAHFEGQE